MSPVSLAVRWSRLSNAAKTVTTTPPCGLASGCSRTTPSSRRRSTWCPRRPGCHLALKLWHHTLLHHSLNKFPSPTMSPVASTKPKQLIQISVLMQVDNIIPNPKKAPFYALHYFKQWVSHSWNTWSNPKPFNQLHWRSTTAVSLFVVVFSLWFARGWQH